MKIQYKKALLNHVLGTIGLMFTAIGIAFTLTILYCTTPFSFLTYSPIIFFTIAFIIETLRGFLARGILDEKGWNFNLKKAVISPITDTYYNITNTAKKILNYIDEKRSYNTKIQEVGAFYGHI